MEKRTATLIGILTILISLNTVASTEILYDFEGNTEGWAPEWGLKQELQTAKSRTRHGDHSLLVKHHFKPKEDSIGFRILFDAPKDFASKPGFAGFTAWIFVPGGDGWQAQIYLHTGSNWKWCAGKLHENLQPGWHQIVITKDEIGDATEVRDIGIQVKNFKLNYKAKIYVDRIEALYATAD